jgi:hypothetical protein
MVSYALTTVARWQAYAGISSLTAAQIAVVENLISMATNYVETYLGRRIMETTYTQEVYDGPYGEYILLKNYPVDSRDTFTLQYNATSENEDEWTTIDSEDYFIDYDEGVIKPSSRGKWLLAHNKYRVTYNAGYSFDNVTTFLSDTEAGDLELACWLVVSEIWAKKTAGGTVQSERLGDYAVTYGPSFLFGSGGISAGGKTALEMILDKYRRWEIESPLTPAQSTNDDDDD